MSAGARRSNPPRAARSPNVMNSARYTRDESDASDASDSDGSGASPFFSPREEERGCPTCRKVPTNTLRLFPDACIFKCPVCMTEEVLNVFAFVPCGHCLCEDCMSRWMPNPGASSPPDIANMNLSNNQGGAVAGAASGRRGRPLMSPHERNSDSTRRRKQTILTSIENWDFNNGIVTDAIFYCDIPETFESPDEEPREVFRQRLADAVNTQANRSFGIEDINTWVYALQRLSLYFEGDNPLEFVNYTITMRYGSINISLTIRNIKGLKPKDVITSITEDDYNKVEIGEPPSRDECIRYFANNILSFTDEVVVISGQELVNPPEPF